MSGIFWIESSLALSTEVVSLSSVEAVARAVSVSLAVSLVEEVEAAVAEATLLSSVVGLATVDG